MKFFCACTCFLITNAETTLPTSIFNPYAPCNKDIKVNWFHLQEHGDTWRSRTRPMVKEWEKAADEVNSRFPGSKFGGASFVDRGSHYYLHANLSDKASAASRMHKAFDNRPTNSPPEWPSREIDRNTRQFDYRKLCYQPEGSLEAVVWSALHLPWDQGSNIVKVITINQITPPHYSGDESLEAREQSKYPAFDKDTYPSSEPAIWPTSQKPRKITEVSDYVSLDFVRDVLAEHKIHLVVNYGYWGGKFTARDIWKRVMRHIGMDTRSLFFLPGVIYPMHANVLQAIQRATKCSWGCATRKVNWFHLQENHDEFVRKMKGMLDNWENIANTVNSRFPGSKFGGAFFTDREFHYTLRSDLTDKTNATRNMRAGFDTFPVPSPDWSEKDTGMRQFAYKSLGYEPQGSLEALIWTILHASWDKGTDVFKVVTINQVSPPHYDGDGSQEAKDQSKYPAFDKDTYPSSEPSFWPGTQKPAKTSEKSNYTTLQYLKSVLAEHNIHLMVNYGPVKNYNAREIWKNVMGTLNINTTESLHWLPGSMNTHDKFVNYLEVNSECYQVSDSPDA